MSFLHKVKKVDLVALAGEMGIEVLPDHLVFDLKRLIKENVNYEEEAVKRLLEVLVDDRKEKEEKDRREYEFKLILEKEKRIEAERLKLEVKRNGNVGEQSENQSKERSFEEMMRMVKLLTVKTPNKSEGWNYFFASLEHAFVSERVPEEFRVKILIVLLGDRAANLMTYVSEEEYKNYEEVKRLVLREYEPSPQACLENFRVASVVGDSGSEITVVREDLVEDIPTEGKPTFGLKGILGSTVQIPLVKMPLGMATGKEVNVHQEVLCAVTGTLVDEVVLPPGIIDMLRGKQARDRPGILSGNVKVEDRQRGEQTGSWSCRLTVRGEAQEECNTSRETSPVESSEELVGEVVPEKDKNLKEAGKDLRGSCISAVGQFRQKQGTCSLLTEDRQRGEQAGSRSCRLTVRGEAQEGCNTSRETSPVESSEELIGEVVPEKDKNVKEAGKDLRVSCISAVGQLCQEQGTCSLLTEGCRNAEREKRNYVVDDYLFRKDKLGGQEAGQLVIPQCRRDDILNLAHCSAFGGHMGLNETAERIRYPFCWEQLKVDLRRFCEAWIECQLTRRMRVTDRIPITPVFRPDVSSQVANIVFIRSIDPLSSKGHKILLLLVYSMFWCLSAIVLWLPMVENSCRLQSLKMLTMLCLQQCACQFSVVKSAIGRQISLLGGACHELVPNLRSQRAVNDSPAEGTVNFTAREWQQEEKGRHVTGERCGWSTLELAESLRFVGMNI